jgi:hypothetical protein
MKVAITGHRFLLESDVVIVRDRIVRLVRDPEVEEVFFGGAIGVDTDALRFALQYRAGPGRPFLSVVVPDTLGMQAISARLFAAQADRVIELHHKITGRDGYAAYKKRNCFMVDQATPCGEVIAFWSGRWRSGTGQTIRYALETDTPWEHVPVVAERPEDEDE